MKLSASIWELFQMVPSRLVLFIHLHVLVLTPDELFPPGIIVITIKFRHLLSAIRNERGCSYQYFFACTRRKPFKGGYYFTLLH